VARHPAQGRLYFSSISFVHWLPEEFELMAALQVPQSSSASPTLPTTTSVYPRNHKKQPFILTRNAKQLATSAFGAPTKNKPPLFSYLKPKTNN